VVKEYPTDKIRNIGLIGHGGSGKTSFAEAILYSAGVTTRLGRVQEGNTISDYHPDEIAQQASINLSLLHCEWKDVKINIVDMPGYADFIGEVKSGLKVTDIALLFVKSVEGIEIGTETSWEIAKEYGNSVIFVVNKLDAEHSNFEKVVEQIRQRFGHEAVAVQFPLNEGTSFNSLVDILKMKLLKFSNDLSGNYVEEEIPQNLKEKVEKMREELIESVAETDEELLNKFFENGGLTEDELKEGFVKAIAERKIFPILCADSYHNIGTKRILDFIVDYCPSPNKRKVQATLKNDSSQQINLNYDSSAEPVIFVFKTVSEAHVGEFSFFKVYSGTITRGIDLLNQSNGTLERLSQLYVMNGKERKEVQKFYAGDIGAVVKLKNTHTNDTLSTKTFPVVIPRIEFPEPVIQFAIISKNKGEEEKIAAGLHALHEEDPTFVFTVDNELQQTLISGQGEMHLTIIAKRLKEKYGVEVELGEPKIPYRETIKGKAREQGKYKRQTGGRGQYGDVWLVLEPLPRGGGFEFVDAIVGGVVPRNYIPAVEKGVRDTMAKGVLAGYPVIDVKVTLDYGSYHPVDSSDLAFQIAASMAFKKAFMNANPVLLEPIYEIEVKVPEEFMGSVIGDISSRRGKVIGMTAEGNYQVVKAYVPQKELYRYSSALRSLTQGRGIFKARFSHYEEVPKEIADKIIAEAQKHKEAVEEE
jgi:elongation factor G